MLKMIIGPVFVLVCALGCSALKSPNLPPDIANIELCIQSAVESGQTDPVTIALSCYPGEQQFVVDFINALINSSWAKDHPNLVPALQAKLLATKTDGGK